jgi:hypothetical protein
MTGGTFNKLLGVSYGITNKEANKYRKLNPEWFKIYKDSTGKKSEHFSPELVERIREEIESIEEAPEGWITKSALIKILKAAHKTINKKANKYRKSNPEWFKIYKDSTGKKSEHLSPELIQEIKEDLRK